MTKAIFLTGASGYVGRHIGRELVSRGHPVIGLARSDRAAAAIDADGMRSVRGDLAAPDSLRGPAFDADIIIHAGFSYTEEGEERTGVDQAATETILKSASADGKARHFIYTSSIFRYGSPDGGCFDESSAVAVNEADWRHRLAEVVRHSATQQLRTSVIRLGWVFGATGGTLADALSVLSSKGVAPTTANNRIPLIDVRDLAALYANVALGADGGIYHGCGKEPLTIADLADLAASGGVDSRALPEGAIEHFNFIFGRDTPGCSNRPAARTKSDIASGIRQFLRERETAAPG